MSAKVSISDLPDFFTPQELKQVLGISLSNAYKLCHSGDFPCCFKASSRKFLISKSAFVKWKDNPKNLVDL